MSKPFNSFSMVSMLALSVAMAGSAIAQGPVASIDETPARTAVTEVQRPAVVPLRSFIDHAVDHAVETVRKLKKKSPKRVPDWLIDALERAYRVYRNEQELAVWRARARQLIADLSLVAETLDAHIEQSAAFEAAVHETQADFLLRLEGLERISSDHGRRLDHIDRAAATTSDEVGQLKRLVAALQGSVEKTQVDLAMAKAALAAAQRRKSNPEPKPRDKEERDASEPRFLGIPARLPGDTLPDHERRAIFSPIGN